MKRTARNSFVDRNNTGNMNINQDITGDIAQIEHWSGSVQKSTCQGLNLPGQASRNKQSESLVAKQEVPI